VSGLTIAVATGAGAAGTAVTVDAASSLTQLVDNINRQVGGVTAAIGEDGNVVLSNETGYAITVGGTVANSGLAAGNYEGFLGLKSASGSDINFSVATGKDPSALNGLGLNQSTGNGTVVGDGNLASATAASAAAAIQQLDTDTGGALNPTTTSTDIVKINGVALGKTSTGSASDLAVAVNAVSDKTGVKATANTVMALSLDFGAVGDLVINGSTVTTSGATDVAGVVTAINTAGVGVKAEADAVTGRLILKSDSGADISVGNDGTNAFATEMFDDPNVAGGSGLTMNATAYGAVRGKVTLTSDNGGVVRIDGDGTASGGTGLGKFGLVAQNSDDNVVGGELNVLSVASANVAIKAIDIAISKVSEKRSQMGAIQNRFTSVISTLQVSSENMSASRSRIQDTDFAAETAELSRTQILQQAGTAMLAQANASSQNVLSLLRG
jgi:flagellin